MGLCPRCGCEDVRYGSSRLRHLLRSITGTRRRFCLNCRFKWIAEHRALRELRAALRRPAHLEPQAEPEYP